jgi:hypothetical protein
MANGWHHEGTTYKLDPEKWSKTNGWHHEGTTLKLDPDESRQMAGTMKRPHIKWTMMVREKWLAP